MNSPTSSKARRKPAPHRASKPSRAPSRAAERNGGISSAAVEKATGRTWDQWLAILDKFDVKSNGHKSAAAFVHDTHNCPPWWSQMVVVGYEQARGLRVKHQTTSGFTANVSRTLPVPLAALFAAWQPAAIKKWIPDPAKNTRFTVRSTTANKYLRLLWIDEKTTVNINFYDKSGPAPQKPAAKSLVTVQHEKLSSAKQVAAIKTFWSKALDAMSDHLGVR